ncbi:hypothethical protein (plasmid) [Ralstonia solanacearum CMR15]|nr:hypothethical protein [Ralstonia solanacearum CMR15]
MLSARFRWLVGQHDVVANPLAGIKVRRQATSRLMLTVWNDGMFWGSGVAP